MPSPGLIMTNSDGLHWTQIPHDVCSLICILIVFTWPSLLDVTSKVRGQSLGPKNLHSPTCNILVSSHGKWTFLHLSHNLQGLHLFISSLFTDSHPQLSMFQPHICLLADVWLLPQLCLSAQSKVLQGIQ